MQQYTWAKVAINLASVCAAWVVLSLLFSQVIDSRAIAWFIGFAVTSNIVLLIVLTNVWLIKKYPSVKTALEKIPGVTFAVPVPEHIRSKILKSDGPKQDELAMRRAAADEAASSSFTLGTLVFEPPEPIQKTDSSVVKSSAQQQLPATPLAEHAHIPRITDERDSSSSEANLISSRKLPEPDKIIDAPAPARNTEPVKGVESAFRRGRKSASDTKKENQKARFHKVCRILKQANEEVTVWTDKEIDALADYRLSPDANDNDMIALLAPQRVVKFYSDRANDFKFHAQLFNSMLMATGKDIDIERVDSSKDLDEGQCTLRFEFKGAPMVWQFDEEGNNVSESFLKNAMYWLGQQTQGTFVPVETPGKTTGYVFVLNRITKELSVSTAFV